MEYVDIIEEGKELEKQVGKEFGKLKKRKGKLDDAFHQGHQEAFEKIDCLKCANCCKTTSPLFREVDIKRLAKHLRMSETQFIKTYLRKDEEGDWVLQTAPCPFLNLDDNKCDVYDSRPGACREYPHTDRKNMYQILNLTQKNLTICPAVVHVVKKIINK